MAGGNRNRTVLSFFSSKSFSLLTPCHQTFPVSTRFSKFLSSKPSITNPCKRRCCLFVNPLNYSESASLMQGLLSADVSRFISRATGMCLWELSSLQTLTANSDLLRSLFSFFTPTSPKYLWPRVTNNTANRTMPPPSIAARQHTGVTKSPNNTGLVNSPNNTDPVNPLSLVARTKVSLYCFAICEVSG
jgi:hypothetical protein